MNTNNNYRQKGPGQYGPQHPPYGSCLPPGHPPHVVQPPQGQFPQRSQLPIGQSPHGHPTPPYGQQAGPMGQNIQANNEVLNPKRHKPDFTVQPSFTEKMRGKGVDQKEYDIIISEARKAYEESKNDPTTISCKIGRELRKVLNGQWFVFVSERGKNFDFALSQVANSDYLTFSFGKTLFQICRLHS